LLAAARAGDNAAVGKTPLLVICVGTALAAACEEPEDPYVPPGTGTDAGPRSDGGPGDAGDPPGDAADHDGGGSDGAPQIVLVSPEPGHLLAGELRVVVEVSDPDGVMTVSATIAGAHAFAMTPESPGSSRYVGTFDTTVLAGVVSPVVIVRATDQTSESAQLGFQVVLDNAPPIASLDPANVRQLKEESGVTVCSRDFDPLGPDAANDGESVPQLIELRARVLDLSNTGTVDSTLFVPTAGVASVALYVLDDTTRPLVVDTDGDGVCDALNPTLVPTVVPMFANEAARVDLVAIPPTGAAYYTADTFGGSNAAVCAAGDDTEAPEPVCLGEPGMTTILKTPFTGLAQIFAIPPADEANCAGFAFDAVASNISDGWACVATVATDQLGNRSVSPPLRICIDSDGDGAECAGWGTIAAPAARPSCTGTVAGGIVTSTPCIARDFFRGGPDEFELVRE